MALRLVTPPTIPVVTLEEAIAHLKIDHDEDDYVNRIIKAAVGHTETEAKIRLAPQYWKQTYHSFPNKISASLKPFISVEALTYRNSEGDVVELETDEYLLDSENFPVTVYPLFNTDWPTDISETTLNAVEFHYKVGFDPLADDDDPKKLPEELKQAVLLLIGHLYANREPIVVGAGIVAANIPKTYDWMIGPYREWLF